MSKKLTTICVEGPAGSSLTATLYLFTIENYQRSIAGDVVRCWENEFGGSTHRVRCDGIDINPKEKKAAHPVSARLPDLAGAVKYELGSSYFLRLMLNLGVMPRYAVYRYLGWKVTRKLERAQKFHGQLTPHAP